MAPLRRTELEQLRRSELQALCKDYGVKANLKSEALIDLLLETSQPPRVKAAPAPQRRSVSTRLSSRSTAPRVSSMIIHDTDEETEEQPEVDSLHGEPDGTDSQTHQESVEPPPPPLPRTRKAKDTQLRLGVGRPKAAGGSGPRAVTRSGSVSKSRRGKGSRGAVPVEATIPEEGEDQEQLIIDHTAHTHPTSHLVPDENQEIETNRNESQPGALASTEGNEATQTTGKDIEKRINDALQPLHQQLQTIKLELDQYKALNNELIQLRSQVAEMDTWKQKVDSLTTECRELKETVNSVNSLKAEISELRNALNRQSNSTPSSDIEMASGFITPTNTQPGRHPACDPSSSSKLPHPGIAAGVLGKRHRDSTTSNITDVVDAGEEGRYSEGELARKVLRPTKKRARITPMEGVSSETGHSDPSSAAVVGSNEEDDSDEDAPHRPGFTVYSGPEPQDVSYVDPPPPTTPLPRLYTATSQSAEAGPSRIPSTQNATENHQPFGLSFLPVPPTPHAASFAMQNFPYPEPPQSPTPGGSVPEMIRNNNTDTMDLFQSFGLPSPERQRTISLASARTPRQENNFVNPAALTRHDDLQFPELSPIDDSDTEGSGLKKTMYGTEVERDTRFGDFGVDGVGSGFWTGSGGF